MAGNRQTQRYGQTMSAEQYNHTQFYLSLFTIFSANGMSANVINAPQSYGLARNEIGKAKSMKANKRDNKVSLNDTGHLAYNGPGCNGHSYGPCGYLPMDTSPLLSRLVSTSKGPSSIPCIDQDEWSDSDWERRTERSASLDLCTDLSDDVDEFPPLDSAKNHEGIPGITPGNPGNGDVGDAKPKIVSLSYEQFWENAQDDPVYCG